MKTSFDNVEGDLDGWYRSFLFAISLVIIYIVYDILRSADWHLPKGAVVMTVLCLLATFAGLLLIAALFGSVTRVESWAGHCLSSHFLVVLILFLLAWPVYYTLRPFWKRRYNCEQRDPSNPHSPSAQEADGR